MIPGHSTVAAPEPPRPATVCTHCSAIGVRSTDKGIWVCWYHLWYWQFDVWSSQCTDTWMAIKVLETVLRAARPLDNARVVELVAYHPLRATIPEERGGVLLHVRAGVHEALGELVALGVLTAGDAGYWWSEEARERVRG